MINSGCSAEGLEPFALRVIGDSMEPEFQDGNIIVIDPGFPLLSGVYAVVIHDQEVLFGQYIQDNTGARIQYLNTEYPAVNLATGFEIKGVVTQRNGRKRKDTKHYDYS